MVPKEQHYSRDPDLATGAKRQNNSLIGWIIKQKLEAIELLNTFYSAYFRTSASISYLHELCM